MDATASEPDEQLERQQEEDESEEEDQEEEEDEEEEEEEEVKPRKTRRVRRRDPYVENSDDDNFIVKDEPSDDEEEEKPEPVRSGLKRVRSASRKKGPVWNYFVEDPVDISFAFCQVPGCPKEKSRISRGRGGSLAALNTTSLGKHLERYHPAQWNQFNEEREKAKERKLEDIAAAKAMMEDGESGQLNGGPAKRRRAKREPGKYDIPVMCPDCGVMISSKSNLRSHWRSKHSGVQPFSCDICGKTSARKDTHIMHMVTHDPSQPKPFLCSYCGKAFTWKTIRNRHEHERHSGDPKYLQKYPCGYCEKKFPTRQRKNRHERSHTGERPYPCNQCDYKAKSLTNLATHRRVHTGERPLQCSRCLQWFKHHSARNKHRYCHT